MAVALVLRVASALVYDRIRLWGPAGVNMGNQILPLIRCKGHTLYIFHDLYSKLCLSILITEESKNNILYDVSLINQKYYPIIIRARKYTYLKI